MKLTAQLHAIGLFALGASLLGTSVYARDSKYEMRDFADAYESMYYARDASDLSTRELINILEGRLLGSTLERRAVSPSECVEAIKTKKKETRMGLAQSKVDETLRLCVTHCNEFTAPAINAVPTTKDPNPKFMANEDVKDKDFMECIKFIKQYEFYTKQGFTAVYKSDTDSDTDYTSEYSDMDF